jgi:hypothetical protein
VVLHALRVCMVQQGAVLMWWTLAAAAQGFGGWAREVGVMAWRILLAPFTLTVTTQEYSLIR